MFDWLFESRLEVFLLLLLIAVTLAYFWKQSRSRDLLLAAIVLMALAGGYLLLGLAVETPREQISRRINDIPDAVNSKNIDRIFDHISSSFKLNEWDKQTTKQKAERALRDYQIRNMRVWDVRVESLDAENGFAKILFNVKADTTFTGDQFLLCRCTFVKDPDGQWRMRTFSLHNPVVDTETPLPLPL